MELSVNWNFVIICDILTDVYDILFQNKLKVTPFYLICRQYVPKRGCYKVLQAIFWIQSRAQLGNWFTVSGCPMELLLEKNFSQPNCKVSGFEKKESNHRVNSLYAFLWEKFLE